MLEGKFTAKLLRALRTHPGLKGAVVWKFSDRWTSGIPDFAVIYRARTAWFEVKVKPNKLTALQQEWIKRLGSCAFVITAESNGRVAYFDGSTYAYFFNELVDKIAEILRFSR